MSTSPLLASASRAPSGERGLAMQVSLEGLGIRNRDADRVDFEHGLSLLGRSRIRARPHLAIRQRRPAASSTAVSGHGLVDRNRDDEIDDEEHDKTN